MTSCISAPRNSFTGSHRYDVSSGSPPLADPTRNSPADRGFYSWASIGSVTLPDARYNYGGNWAIATGGTRPRWNSSKRSHSDPHQVPDLSNQSDSLSM